MTAHELREAIDHTKAAIYRVRQQIEETTEPKEKRRFRRRLKECNIYSFDISTYSGKRHKDGRNPATRVKEFLDHAFFPLALCA